MIYGFVAPKQVGKTTAVNILKKHLPKTKTEHINFKDAMVQEIKDRFPDLLREMVKTYWPHIEDEDHPIDDLFQHKPPLMRALMQNYGTEVRRQDDPHYWVRQWRKSVAQNRGKHILVDGVRFQNEANAVKYEKGILIRLVRSDMPTNTDQHTSETEQEQIECDHTITVGRGEFDLLEEALLKIIK